MNFKKRIIALLMLLSLSFIVPEVPIINQPIGGNQSVAVVQAKKKAIKKKAKKTTKQKAKKATKKKSTKVKKEVQVYVTETGECYHTHACGRGNFYKAPLSTAKARGLRPCKKCY